MIVLGDGSEYVRCSCGTNFIVEPKDVRVLNTGRELIKVVECPKCKTPHHIIYNICDGSEIIDVLPEEEKKNENVVKEKTEESTSEM